MSAKPTIDLRFGDSRELIRAIPDNSIDGIGGDPPYMIGFMGAKFDTAKNNIAVDVAFWRECLRVLKPGGFMFMFGGTRTSHRMVCAIEDAGFYICDSIRTPTWCFGSGFPKSHNISKALDRASGAERVVVGKTRGGVEPGGKFGDSHLPESEKWHDVTVPTTDAAKQYAGFGTALKPAWEPLCLARKPLEKGLNTAQNIKKWGTGGLNIDACRISSTPRTTHKDGNRQGSTVSSSGDWGYSEHHTYEGAAGRWPANVILSPSDVEVLDAQTGTLKSGKPSGMRKAKGGFCNGYGGIPVTGYGDEGGASRFFQTVDFEPGELDYLDAVAPLFYIPKASQAERHAGCEHLPDGKNTHPTVKPVALLEQLLMLITPPGGTVLDPFMGSGSEALAAYRRGFGYIGMELEKPFFDIATARLCHAQGESGLFGGDIK